MRSRHRLLTVAVAAASLLIVGPAVANAGEAKGADALPPLSAADTPLDLVGDADGVRLGVSIVSDTEAIAYLCDGANLGIWFKGTVDLATGAVALKSASGDTITLDLHTDPTTATVTVDGRVTTYDVEPATGPGRVLRVVNKGVKANKGHRYTTGWIIADDYSVVGVTADESGRVVATTNTSAATPPPPPTGGTGTTGPTDPVATGAVRCAILAGRIQRQARLTNEANAAGDASGVAEHGSFTDGLVSRAQGLECAGF